VSGCSAPDLGGLQLAVIIVAGCIGYAIVRLTNAYVAGRARHPDSAPNPPSKRPPPPARDD
jgi:hypothetical protein